MNIDDLDLKILNEIWGGNRTVYKIGKALREPERMIRYHIKKLVKENLLTPVKKENKTLYVLNNEKAFVSVDVITVIDKKSGVTIHTKEGSDVHNFVKKHFNSQVKK